MISLTCFASSGPLGVNLKENLNDLKFTPIIDDVEKFANWLSTKEVIDYRGSKKIKTNWYGGNYFVKEDKIFNDLPINTAFNCSNVIISINFIP